MYGSETWTLASDTKKRLESCEMWFLRRMMKIPWTDKVSNEEVLTRAGVQRKMIREMLIRQLKFMGHTTRKEGLENLALTRKLWEEGVGEEGGYFGWTVCRNCWKREE